MSARFVDNKQSCEQQISPELCHFRAILRKHPSLHFFLSPCEWTHIVQEPAHSDTSTFANTSKLDWDLNILIPENQVRIPVFVSLRSSTENSVITRQIQATQLCVRVFMSCFEPTWSQVSQVGEWQYKTSTLRDLLQLTRKNLDWFLDVCSEIPTPEIQGTNILVMGSKKNKNSTVIHPKCFQFNSKAETRFDMQSSYKLTWLFCRETKSTTSSDFPGKISRQ